MAEERTIGRDRGLDSGAGGLFGQGIRASVRQGGMRKGRLSGFNCEGMGSCTVVSVRSCSRTRIYTGAGRHLDGPRRRHSVGWLSPTRIFLRRLYGDISAMPGPLSHETDPPPKSQKYPSIYLPVVPKASPQRGPPSKIFIIENCKMRKGRRTRQGTLPYLSSNLPSNCQNSL